MVICMHAMLNIIIWLNILKDSHESENVHIN